ncbi:hypothetical protein GKQ23_14835 [Erwinia sp. E602]|uniref:hypothetical protein n=1 Tax=Erwinia sp. E602 TaxID=2675378 RepID=UPI001BAA4C95|nr:hypothetical protein [Erwinia sp. E602]QUG76196.1 hypothetical protein GKQ23_14835 [Erwinia sp. E602]
MFHKCISKPDIIKSHKTEGDEKENKNSLLRNLNIVNNNIAKILIVGYSPTGGGHTARTLNVVEHALQRGSLPAGSQVYFHVPPRWEGTPRPALLEILAKTLLSNGISVILAESDKPVYGYLDEKTGSSNDPEILKRIALHPLRDKEKIGKNAFLNKYFPCQLPPQKSSFKNYTPGDDFENLPRISAFTMMENIIRMNDQKKDNIWVLSDMDPGLQKAAHKNCIPRKHRVDQQNHAILLKENDINSNLLLANAVLSKVLDARGAGISHIALGGKNTLIDAWKTATKLGVDEKTPSDDRKSIINKIIYPFAKSPDDSPCDIVNGCVLKGHGVDSPKAIEKVIYTYAHKKTNIIAEHVKKQLKTKHLDYLDKLFIFCGKNAIPGYNAMHLAYLTDADGITTAGAGTSGEFAYLHRKGGAKSSLLILPIENHNEQEAIADTLHLEFPEHILRIVSAEPIEYGKKIDEVVRRKSINQSGTKHDSGQLMKAISSPGSYVEQTHDILFSHADMSEQMINFWKIQRKMYHHQDMKATRLYLKLYFQLTTYLSMDNIHFPVEIFFKKDAPPAITFDDLLGVNRLFSNNTEMKKLINMSSEKAVYDLPLFNEVKCLMTRNKFPLSEDAISHLNEKFGHYMTTGF